jgi:hypothetical protein
VGTAKAKLHDVITWDILPKKDILFVFAMVLYEIKRDKIYYIRLECRVLLKLGVNFLYFSESGVRDIV